MPLAQDNRDKKIHQKKIRLMNKVVKGGLSHLSLRGILFFVVVVLGINPSVVLSRRFLFLLGPTLYLPVRLVVSELWTVGGSPQVMNRETQWFENYLNFQLFSLCLSLQFAEWRQNIEWQWERTKRIRSDQDGESEGWMFSSFLLAGMFLFFFPESSASTLTWLHLIGHWGRALPCSSPEGGWIQPALPDLEVRARRAWWDPGAGRNRAYRCCCCSWAPHDSNEALRSPHVGWEQRPPYVDLANPVVWQGRCTLLLSSSGCRWDGCLHAPLFGWQGWGNAGDQSVGAAPPRRDPLFVPNPLLRRLHAET